MLIEIRNDDVFLQDNLTAPMCRARKVKPFWEQFIEVDKWFDDRNIPMVLACLADGIDNHPELVEYIKKRLHRFRIELHGHTHINFRHIKDEEVLYNLLNPAKEKLEETFGIKVTRWYAPFSRRGFPGGSKEIGIRVCKKMGIQFHTHLNGKIPHHYFHYWRPDSVDHIKHVLIGKEAILK